MKIYYREVIIMAYKIDESKCVNCGACEGECPTGSISEKDGHRWINPDTCADCGACVSACPCDAISEG
jgi:ferredoxin